jgi:hypothetical protein
MPSLIDLFLATEPVLPVHRPPTPPSPPSPPIMDSARLPTDRFLIYAEEGTGMAFVAITVKK